MEQVRILQVRIVQQVRILRIGLPLDDHAEPFHLCLTARHLVARRVAVSRDVPFVVYEVRPTRHAPPGLRPLVNQARLVNPLADRAVGRLRYSVPVDPIEPRGGTGEHRGGGGQRCVAPSGDVLIERGGVFEHRPHVCDLRGIPRADLSLIHI